MFIVLRLRPGGLQGFIKHGFLFHFHLHAGAFFRSDRAYRTGMKTEQGLSFVFLPVFNMSGYLAETAERMC